MAIGEDIDHPQIANLITPQKTLTINGMVVDMERFAQAAQALSAEKGDVLTIDGYRDAKGHWIPDYSSIRIEKRYKA